jgi:Protein kinase domain
MAALRRALARVLPEWQLDAETRARIDDERQAYNRRTVFVVVPILLGLHVLVALGFSRVHGTTPADARWIYWLVRLHAGMAVVAALLFVAALRESQRATFLRPWLGDLTAALYVLFGAIVNANGQRAHAALNMFVLSNFAVAIVFRARPWVFLVSLAAGCGVVVTGALALHPDASIAVVNAITAVAFAIVALVTFLFVHGSRVREVIARFELERGKAELEGRVEAQVRAIVAHAKDIEQLNVQLNEKVRLRSEELSQALARLAAAPRALLAPALGTLLGERVEIQGLIGSGGMGVVYRGYDRVAQAPVAVKLIHTDSVHHLDDLHRFLQEARALATVQHPAIVRLLHVDISVEGQLFEIMELVEGQSLEARQRADGSLPWTTVARLGAILADALACAHAAGIVHRDVKPSNVMLTQAPPGLKLLDFGVAKLRDAHSFGTSDTGLLVLGTPEFMAPEQILASGSVNDRADVYATGMLLYQCLAGRGPYAAHTASQWMQAHVHEDARDLRAWLVSCPDELADLVMACLRKRPQERPRAADLAQALAALADAAHVPALDVLERARPTSATTAPFRTDSATVETAGSTAVERLRSGGVTRKDEG